jgi:hypothetical protein
MICRSDVNPERPRSKGHWFQLIHQGLNALCNNRVFLLLMSLTLSFFSYLNSKRLHRLMNWIRPHHFAVINHRHLFRQQNLICMSALNPSLRVSAKLKNRILRSLKGLELLAFDFII